MACNGCTDRRGARSGGGAGARAGDLAHRRNALHRAVSAGGARSHPARAGDHAHPLHHRAPGRRSVGRADLSRARAGRRRRPARDHARRRRSERAWPRAGTTARHPAHRRTRSRHAHLRHAPLLHPCARLRLFKDHRRNPARVGRRGVGRHRARDPNISAGHCGQSLGGRALRAWTSSVGGPADAAGCGSGGRSERISGADGRGTEAVARAAGASGAQRRAGRAAHSDR